MPVRRLFPILFGLLPLTGGCGAPPTEAPSAEHLPAEISASDDVATGPALAQGVSLEQTLVGGESYVYTIDLNAGDFIWLVVEQRRVDVVVSLLSPDGHELTQVDSFNGPDGPEHLIAKSEAGGKHRVRIEAPKGEGEYTVRVVATGPPTARDSVLLHALESYREAGELMPSGNAADLERATSLLEGALTELPRSSPGLIRARFYRRLGLIQAERSRFAASVEALQTARDLFLEHGNGWEQGPTLNDLGKVLLDLGLMDRAKAALQLALERSEEVGNVKAVAAAWNNLGLLHAYLGEPSEALDAYGRARELWRNLGDRRQEATHLHNMGAQLLALGRIEDGLDHLRQAATIRRLEGDEANLGRSLASLAWGLSLDEQTDAALDAYQESLDLLAAAGAEYDLAVALEQRAELLRRSGRLDEAREDLTRSLEILESAPELELHGAYVRVGLGAVLRELGQPEAALQLLQRSTVDFDALEVQDGRVLARVELARTHRVLGRREAAARELEEALDAVESVRRDLRLPAFRRTYLGGQQDLYSELMDLLAEGAMETADPNQRSDLAIRAFEVMEQARARSLLESLVEARKDVECRASGTLCERERSLIERVEALEMQHVAPSDAGGRTTEVRPDNPPESSLEALRRIRLELEQVQEVIHRTSDRRPGYVEPESFSAVQDVLDDETLLLAYALGPRRSWLWRVERNPVDGLDIDIVALPSRSEIEVAARRVHDLVPMSTRTGYRRATNAALRDLSGIVLGPVADAVSRENVNLSRIAVMVDGALNLVPFDILLIPGKESAEPLFTRYEVVHLPSLGTLAHLRERRTSREVAPKFLALIADPVCSPEDQRLRRSAPSSSTNPSEEPDLARVRQAFGGQLKPLPASVDEVEKIAELAANWKPLMVTGFAANRSLVSEGRLSQFRLLHFATHGLVDADDPRLASLVLSLFDEKGRPRDGLLRARDLYNLNLSADLVVLSACRTALGHEIRGEGLVGLTQGFFAAGASHLVLSFWDVNDQATAELMIRFYHYLLKDGHGPTGALRLAKLELFREAPRRPLIDWAAFASLGDWQVSLTPLR